MSALPRLFRHLWLDAGDARRAIGPDAMQRLEVRVRDSERQHTGEICLCVEASLPLSYLWRHVRGAPIAAVVRERAVTLFGKLRVWDTELNNGVLIYLQLAEHRIEIVADRAVARTVGAAEWQRMVDEATPEFRTGRYAEGLERTIDAVNAVLRAAFPAVEAGGEGGERANQLPNQPVVR
ncbi:TPM domain-containing protein [Aromatoleum evansii]|uniref:TPM domain-containing protein n=1 Tax=Aromatoleum evansii TaxID=59406 RepID=A0ABZ1ARY0_AROEV|nr:TPM domain-containing protein [Aromatoleum evansii]NMG30860.1 TPM domain-containing protein [Aromatoleum evansii]WRL48631.1 TPM domain-containing protein [Aromatoleum evansii]